MDNPKPETLSVVELEYENLGVANTLKIPDNCPGDATVKSLFPEIGDGKIVKIETRMSGTLGDCLPMIEKAQENNLMILVQMEDNVVYSLSPSTLKNFSLRYPSATIDTVAAFISKAEKSLLEGKTRRRSFRSRRNRKTHAPR